MNVNPAHDRINLSRLVNRLQLEVEKPDDWRVSPETQRQTALHATAVARKIAYARQLLQRVQDEDIDEPQSSSRQRFHASIAATLDKLEDDVQEVERRLAALRATAKPRPSLLASLPLPRETAPASTPSAQTEPTATLIPSDGGIEKDVLPSSPPHDIDEPLALLPPANTSSSKAHITTPTTLLPSTTPAFLSTSLQTQDALGAELARMATQLRRNAEHFSGALANDKSVLEGAETKLEENLGGMVAQRERLRDYSYKGRSTTWLVFISVIVVIISWIFMLFLIRFTR
ncbi:hypothetical protein EXIGLDRAFT_722781 [Exidia glandulosa HHB12029]|uniref:t-SNARE coiled-coil homology domain-containing protein n=1 Tax=Exidia glandulosa HHB12029 TaxID=1314781 RepID=A0A165F3U4_EXIGL|nr:hypothetical protein EXIGLDRAFT_722781 [Exidia glandulosa HHB12029]